MFDAFDEVLVDGDIALHVQRVRAQVVILPHDDLLRALHVIHPVIVVAGIDDVPVAHHLPAAGLVGDGQRDDLVRIIGTGRGKEQFKIPHIVVPIDYLKIVILEMLVRILGRLSVQPVALESARLRQCGAVGVDGMTAQGAHPIRRGQTR